MGHFSVEICTLPGSILSANQQLAPWLVEAAIGRLGERRLSEGEQRVVVNATLITTGISQPLVIRNMGCRSINNSLAINLVQKSVRPGAHYATMKVGICVPRIDPDGHVIV